MNLCGAGVVTIMLVEMVAITKRRHLAILDVMGMTVGTLREVVNRKENDILKFRRRASRLKTLFYPSVHNTTSSLKFSVQQHQHR